MLKASFLSLLLFVFSVNLHAQLSEGGIPPGYKWPDEWDEVPLHKSPTPDTAALRAEDAAQAATGNKRLRYGFATFVSITPATHGRWRALGTDRAVWQLRITSPGAYSIALGFRNVQLPEGARLFIYNADRSTVLGAFTSRQVYINDKLATEQVAGSELMVEYEVDAALQQEAPFEIFRISHDYRNVMKLVKGFGDAGDCQVNVNCPEGANHQDVKKAVAAIFSSGSGLCTGTLVTTTNNSGIPYFLTANHCYDSNEDDWVFRFNWESAGCADPGSSPTYQSIAGSMLRARSENTDFCLVELSTTPPSSYGIVYDGWSRSAIPATATVGISHPALDIKKICFAPSPATFGTFGIASCWQTGTWTGGPCTEPGSSGSALFDQNKRIVGQLFGGPSYCGAPASDMYDLYGRFDLSWTGDGTNATRLSNWLDPAGLNPVTTDLYDPNTPSVAVNAALNAIITPAADTLCATDYTPAVIIRNAGINTLTTLSIGYRLNGGSTVTTTWTGSLASNQIDTVSLTALTTTTGNHALQVFTYLPNGSADMLPGNDTLTRSFSVVLSPAVTALPVNQGFESTTFPPAGWTRENPDGGETWERTTNAYYNGTAAALKDNYNDPNTGEQDHLYTPAVSLSDTNYNYRMAFRVAYARYNDTYIDSLQVWASADCGASWAKLYSKGGSALATAPDASSEFVPTAAQWRRDSISLNSYLGAGPLQLRMTNVNGYGNLLYLDSVAIYRVVKAPIAAFGAVPDTACAGVPVSFADASLRDSVLAWAFSGGAPATSAAQNPSVVFATPGSHTVQLTASNPGGSSATNRTIYVLPSPDVTITNAGGVLSVPAGQPSYQWYLDGAPIAGATGNTWTTTGDGAYSVVVTGTNDCAITSEPYQIGLAVGNAAVSAGLRVFPNPAGSTLEIRLPATLQSGSTDIRLIDALGRVARTATVPYTSQGHTLDVRALPRGTYLLSVGMNGKRYAVPVVLQ